MLYNLLSDQFYNYSDISYENGITQRQNTNRIATKKSAVDHKFSGTRRRSARIANRTVFAMRQAELQMCQGPWTRTETLSIDKSSQKPARDVLRVQRLLRKGPEIIGPICSGTRNFGRDQHHQCRTNPSARGVMNDHISLFYRYWSYCSTSGQYLAIGIEQQSMPGGNQQ